MIGLEALALGIAPALLWLLYFYRRDRFEPEPKRLVMKTFAYGALATVPAAILESLSPIDLPSDTAIAASVLTAGAGRTEAWLEALRTAAPELAERVLGGTVTAPIRGSVGLPNHLRRAAGPGWALVGDAGYHRDPITGHGLTDAFRDAELLADAADAVLRYDADERVAMTEYERQRDDAIRDTFRITRALAAFPPPQRFAELQVELSRALDIEARELAVRPALADAVSVC